MFKRPRVNDEIGKALDFKSESSIPVPINLPASDKKEEKKRVRVMNESFKRAGSRNSIGLSMKRLLCSENYVRNMGKTMSSCRVQQDLKLTVCTSIQSQKIT